MFYSGRGCIVFSLFIVGTMGDAILQKRSVCGGKLGNKLKNEELLEWNTPSSFGLGKMFVKDLIHSPSLLYHKPTLS